MSPVDLLQPEVHFTDLSLNQYALRQKGRDPGNPLDLSPLEERWDRQMLARETEKSHLERRNRAMMRLVVAVQELSLARSLDAIMKVVRRAARDLTGADGATFVLRDGDKCHYADEDAIAPLWKGQRFPITACISGWAILNRKPAVVEDIFLDNRIPVDAYRSTFVKSLVVMPIRATVPLGAIGAYWSQPHLATSEEVDLLQALANTTAVALESIQLHAELEKRVKERTQQLAVVNEELEALHYSVSHDLQAAVRNIGGFCQLLTKQCGASLDGSATRHCGFIASESKRMDDLLQDLMRLAKVSRAGLKMEPVNLSTAAQDFFGRMRLAEPNRDVTVEVQEDLKAMGDLGLLRLVLQNLLGNAWKYTSTRNGALIEFGRLRQGNGADLFFVRDNGVGFDMKRAAKLFVPFQRLHHGRNFPGSGIGLATVRRIVNRHGGKIWAQSEPGKGACFFFHLV